jgi:hypothetical protein
MRRNNTLIARFTDDELKRVEINRTILGLTKSQYLRLCALLPLGYITDSESTNSIIAVDKKTSTRFYTELKRVDINLNQAVRAINGIAKWLDENKNEFDQNVLLDFIKEVREYNNNIKLWQKEHDAMAKNLKEIIKPPTFIQYPTTDEGEEDG